MLSGSTRPKNVSFFGQELDMSQASLTFTLPDESHEFKAAANAGSLQAAIQDLERLLRDKDKYGSEKDKSLTAAQVRGLLREVLRDHDAEWALE